MIWAAQSIVVIHPVAQILSWDVVPGAVSYDLLRSGDPYGIYIQLNDGPIPNPAPGSAPQVTPQATPQATPTIPRVTFPMIGAQGTAYYKVKAWDKDGNFSESDPIPVTIG